MDNSLRSIPNGSTSTPISGIQRPSAQAWDVPTAAWAAGTWTVTVTSVAPAPAAIDGGVIVIVEPVGPPLAERATASGNVDPVEGAMLRL